ncbi:hypothetical protein MHU86_10806 [Fragilaria crotonensis]|nr:hypothetical protein MHU86_10806 [Fragilaria crotonensis]
MISLTTVRAGPNSSRFQSPSVRVTLYDGLAQTMMAHQLKSRAHDATRRLRRIQKIQLTSHYDDDKSLPQQQALPSTVIRLLTRFTTSELPYFERAIKPLSSTSTQFGGDDNP